MDKTMKRMQYEILPSEEKRDEILKNILDKKREMELAELMEPEDGQSQREKLSGRQKGFGAVGRACIGGAVAAAIAAICVTGLPQRTFAYIQRHFLGNYFENETLIEDKVEDNVFRDEDKHIRLSIEELYADSFASAALVHYEALDKDGEIFLSATDFNDVWLKSDGLEQAVEWAAPSVRSESLQELKSRRDGKNKYFLMECMFRSKKEADRDSHWTLAYCLSNYRRKEKVVQTADFHQEMASYNLVLEGHEPYQDLQPTQLQVSSISFRLRGKNVGHVDPDSGKVVRKMKHMLWNMTRDDLVIHMKDGQFLSCADYGISGMSSLYDKEPGDDIMLLSGFLSAGTWDGEDWEYGEIEEREDQPVFIADPEEVDYIEIKGEKYLLEKQK